MADFSRPFTYTLTDNDGDTATSTLTINVDNVNGAPALDATDLPFLVAVSEDAVAPVGAVGTLVSSLVDLASAGGFDNVTDADGPGLGIAITATNSANGTWFYSTNNGVTWIAVGAVSMRKCVAARSRRQHPALFPAGRQLQRHGDGRHHIPCVG